jgi:hypothetical protein
MSTRDECLAQGLLFTISGNLRPRQQPERLLMVTADARAVLVQDLKTMTSDNFYSGSQSPLEQTADIFNRFVSGDAMGHPLPPHEMSPHGQGVFRLRTHDMRFDGWFPAKNFFVIAAIHTKQQCNAPGFNNAIYAQVRATRQVIGLNGGTFMTAGDYRDLIQL